MSDSEGRGSHIALLRSTDDRDDRPQRASTLINSSLFLPFPAQGFYVLEVNQPKTI